MASLSGRPLKSANRSSIGPPSAAPRPGLAQQIVDQKLRVDLLLDVQWRRLHDQVGPVLLVFAAPDELRVEIAVTFVRHRCGALVPFSHKGFLFSGRDIAALVLVPQYVDRDVSTW